MNSNSQLWRNIRTAENLLALVQDIDERRRCIQTHACHEGSWDAVLDESLAIKRAVNLLHEEVSRVWDLLYEAATATEVIERWALLEGER